VPKDFVPPSIWETTATTSNNQVTSCCTELACSHVPGTVATHPVLQNPAVFSCSLR
jgi:hypothetical protein